MDGWKRKTAPPIVIDRYHFKQDREGYLKQLYTHIGIFDLAAKTAKMVTTGNTDDRSPVVVSGWQADRVPEQARARRSGPHVERGPLGRRGARRRRAAADHEARPKARPAGRPGALMAAALRCTHRRHGPQRRLLDEQAGCRPGEPPGLGRASREAVDLHAVPRSRGVEPCLVGRRAATSPSCCRTIAPTNWRQYRPRTPTRRRVAARMAAG